MEQLNLYFTPNANNSLFASPFYSAILLYYQRTVGVLLGKGCAITALLLLMNFSNILSTYILSTRNDQLHLQKNWSIYTYNDNYSKNLPQRESETIMIIM